MIKNIKKIRFEFEGDTKGINIEDTILINIITSSIIENLNNSSLQNWEKKLNAIKNFTKQDEHTSEFRERVSKSVYHFLKEENILNFGNAIHPDRVMYCIADLFKIAEIPLYNKKKVPHDHIVDRQEIKSLVKSWCIRKKNVRIPQNFSINPDRIEKLKQYFDHDLINCVNSKNSLKELKSAVLIAKIYNANKLIPELSHLIKCLKQKKLEIGEQDTEFNKYTKNLEFKNFAILLEASKLEDNILESLTFKAKDSKEEYVLKSDLLIHLLLDALYKYQNKYPEELNWDLFEPNINTDATIKFFKAPHERFLPKFCKSFYSFLLNELPPEKKELFPSKRYIKIITATLKEGNVLTEQNFQVELNIEKVRHWLHLANFKI